MSLAKKVLYPPSLSQWCISPLIEVHVCKFIYLIKVPPPPVQPTEWEGKKYGRIIYAPNRSAPPPGPGKIRPTSVQVFLYHLLRGV